MDYTIQPDRPVLDEVRRVAHIQLRRARRDLEAPGDDMVEAVHDTRKRCKKLRGLIRLVRPALGDAYDPANAVFREAARELSPLRDAHALLATFDDLVAAQRDPLPDGGLREVRAELQARSDRATLAADADARAVEAARELLADAAPMIDDWELADDGFDAVAGGLHKTYRRAEEALADAVDGGSDQDFHEYRKRTKYGWYHSRLLDRLAPTVMRPMADALHTLADALGDDHDLAVLVDQLRAEPDAFGGDDGVAAAEAVVTPRREELQDRAVRLGARCHAEDPDAFVGRIGRYWEARATYGPELAAGEIAAIWPPADDGLEGLNVGELRAWASDNEIPGRSKLRRDELVAAIRADG